VDGIRDVAEWAYKYSKYVESTNQHFVASSWFISYIISTMHGHTNTKHPKLFVKYMYYLLIYDFHISKGYCMDHLENYYKLKRKLIGDPDYIVRFLSVFTFIKYV
jgi:hypothetical protein